MSEWDYDETLIDEDFAFEDDGDAESHASYGEEEDYEEEGEFTEEDYEEEDLVPAMPMLSRFTPPAPPKRGVGGIIRDPNAPVPKPMENCPIPFDGWDTTVTRDDAQQSEDGVQAISKKDAAPGGASNTGPSQNVSSGIGAPLIPKTAEDHAAQEPTGGVENSSSASSTVKSETDDNVQVDGEVELDAVKPDCSSDSVQELQEAHESCTSQNDSNESKENAESNANEENNAVSDPNETSTIQNPDEKNSSQNNSSKCNGDDEEQTENGASQNPGENYASQDSDQNGTSQNDSDGGSGDEEPGETSADQSTENIDAGADGLKDGLTKDNKSTKPEATEWPKIVTLLHAVFLVVCAVWLVSVASPLRYNPKWGFPMLRRMDLSGQTAIVTGANRGIGLWITRFLVEQGAEVIMGCRNQTDCEAAAAYIRLSCLTHEAQVHPWQLDLSSFQSVRRFAQRVMEKHRGGALDMMFLNAGIGSIDGQSALSEHGIERVFATNFVGHNLLHSLLAALLLNAKPAARVVAIADEAHRLSLENGVATDLSTLNSGARKSLYAQSKLAMILWVQELTRLQGPNSTVYINSCHPGHAGTDISFGSTSMDKFRRLLPGILRRQLFGSPQQAALTPLYLGVHTKDLIAKNIRGKYFLPIAYEHTPHVQSQNLTLQKAVWKFANDLIGHWNFLD